MKAIRTKAIMLARTNFGEADRILRILTPRDGKISAIARGVRKEKSKLAGGIELFARCDLTVQLGRSELGTITSARTDVSYQHILKDYDRLQFGYVVIKQTDKAAESLDEPAFFELLDQALSALNDLTLDLRIIEAWFWLQLAILVGEGMNLSSDDTGERLAEEATYIFDPVQSVLRIHKHGNITAEHIKMLRLLSAHSPRVARQVQDIEQVLDNCLWVTRNILSR